VPPHCNDTRPGRVRRSFGSAGMGYVLSEQVVLETSEVVASASLRRHDTAPPVHAHEFMEIVVVKSGAAQHRTRSGSSPIGAGSVMLVRPGQWHTFDHPRDLQIWNLYVPYKTLVTELATLRRHPVLAAFTSATGARAGAATGTRAAQTAGDGKAERLPGVPAVELATIEPYLVELAKPAPEAGDGLTRLGLLLVVLDKLAPAFNFPKPGQGVAMTHPAVVAAARLLDAEPGHPWALAELAGRVHISRSYLCRLFTCQLGISPLRYLERRRLELASQLLLQGDLAISQVSARTGWPDSNYMARRFRATYGMAPSRYREEFRRPQL
jgi:AraC family transcriptional regulator, L-rhamnose operon transcriptional activator RhaR